MTLNSWQILVTKLKDNTMHNNIFSKKWHKTGKIPVLEKPTHVKWRRNELLHFFKTITQNRQNSHPGETYPYENTLWTCFGNLGIKWDPNMVLNGFLNHIVSILYECRLRAEPSSSIRCNSEFIEHSEFCVPHFLVCCL